MKLAYYPGCSLEGSGMEYGMSTERTAEVLGIELIELDDWNCCGATSGHSTDKLLSLALPARNLAIAEEAGLPMLAPCAACYSRHRVTEHTVKHDEKMRQTIAQIIDRDIQGTTETLSILDVLANHIGVDKITEKVTRPLLGMKAVCYYGCLLVRPVEYTGFDDPEDPQTMDRVVKALGAEALDWAHKTECCGASLVTSRPEVGNRMLYEILRNAKEVGAECIVTACPLCGMNLDMRQGAVEKEFNTKFDLPVYYVTELVALAAGESRKAVGIDRHFVEAGRYLDEVAKRAEKIKAELEAKAQAKAESQKADGEKVDPEARQKKIDAMIKAFEKNPDKMAKRLIDDEERAAVLLEIISEDSKKAARLAELMVDNSEKASKAADAFVTAELKKRDK
jgi:heterodisulfide reductase subunit B